MPPKTIVRFVAMTRIPSSYVGNAAEADRMAEEIALRSEGEEVIRYQVTFLEQKKVKATKQVTVEDA